MRFLGIQRVPRRGMRGRPCPPGLPAKREGTPCVLRQEVLSRSSGLVNRAADCFGRGNGGPREHGCCVAGWAGLSPTGILRVKFLSSRRVWSFGGLVGEL